MPRVRTWPPASRSLPSIRSTLRRAGSVRIWSMVSLPSHPLSPTLRVLNNFGLGVKHCSQTGCPSRCETSWPMRNVNSKLRRIRFPRCPRCNRFTRQRFITAMERSAAPGPDGGQPRPIHLLQRGDVDQPVGPELGPGGLSLVQALPATFDLPSNHAEQDRRAALARWLSSRENPLTWRSIVNRVWLYHFGRGLVDTPNDFGRMGQAPSHPELLDWLAVDFRDGGRIAQATSPVAGHQQRLSAIVGWPQPRRRKSTPAIVWLWRMNRRRLEAEALRDGMLQIAGQLDSTWAAPASRISPSSTLNTRRIMNTIARLRTIRPRCAGRSIAFIVRSKPQPLMTVLDCADPSHARRETQPVALALAGLGHAQRRLRRGHVAAFCRADRCRRRRIACPGRARLP